MMRIIVTGALLSLAGCQGIQSPLAPGGDQAAALHGLFLLMMLLIQQLLLQAKPLLHFLLQIGRASCRERV